MSILKKFCVMGMPGSGKSYVAENLKQNRKLCIPIVDSDILTQKLLLNRVPNSDFFICEKLVFDWIKHLPYSHILFTGGSSPLREPWLFDNYETIWLNPPLSTCFKQFKTKERVGLNPNMNIQEYSELYLERKKIYTKSKYVIDNSDKLVQFIERLTGELGSQA